MANEKYLENIVPEYRSKIKCVRDLFLSRVNKSIELAQLSRGDRVLDAGCGEGMLLKKIAEIKGIKRFGLDHNPLVKELKVCHSEIICADLSRMPYKSEFFDKIFCLDTLEHITLVENVVKELERIMRKDALLVVCGPAEGLFYKLCRFLIKGTFSAEKGPCSSPHFHNINSLKKIIENQGFKTKKVIRLPEYPLLPLFRILLFEKSRE